MGEGVTKILELITETGVRRCPKSDIREVKKKKKKKHFDGFNPQWGGGSQSESTLHVFFLLLM